MENKVLQLRKLNAAYIAALEWDRCPSGKKAEEVAEIIETGITDNELGEALNENQGRRPDEIASDMSDIIKTL